MKIHVCVDARMINNSGIGVYIRHFIGKLINEPTIKVTILGRINQLSPYFDINTFTHIEADFPIYSVIEQHKLPRLIPVCDLFWSPHYNAPLLPIKAKRFLITVPDVFHLAFYNTLSLPQKLYAKTVLNLAVRKADRIITISNYSKKEIVHFTRIRPSKIHVIYLGLDKALFCSRHNEDTERDVRKRYLLPEQYILFVGNVKPNKNLRSLVQAFHLLLARLPNQKLLIVGKKEGFITGDEPLFDSINNDSSLKDRIAFTGYVANEDLPTLYSMASVFAFPSIYEGFGFPPLEAMACGCPVVASNKASIPEICGEAAIFVDPADSEQFADALFRVITDESLKSSLVQKGYEKILDYDWDKAGHLFIKEVKSLIHK